MKADKFNIRKTVYNNAISYKFDNRRITVAKYGNGYALQLRIVQEDPDPCALHERLKGKVNETSLGLSEEGAEVLLFSLAELMGYEIISKR
jgi:hypothetical protein